MAHAVGFHPERIVESVRRHVCKIIGGVGGGCAVQVRSAYFLHRVDVATRCVLAAAKHQVLEQMRETRFAKPLVFRADVIPDVHGDDGGLVVFMDDQRKTVVEHEFVKGDVDLVASLRKQAVGENAAYRKREDGNQ